MYQCRSCNLHFRFPRLAKQVLDSMYEEGSCDHWQHSPDLRPDWTIAAQVIRSTFATGTVLDVGCFDGQFLDILRGDYEVAGVEIHPEAARRAENRGIRLVSRNYEDLYRTAERFNAVVAIDLIEHTPDPLSFMRALTAITSRGGIIIVATGNTDALPWRFSGSRYTYCAVAEHISFINPKWCRCAAERLDLDIVSTRTYCHAPITFRRHVLGIAKGVLYRVAPNLVARLRRMGVGGVDVKQRPAVTTYPPAWHGAVDHFLTVFQKK
jgi:2-polyprenyl-3-methyl-5-hydroxy-6-metoxy-1,4-benzoquinol methylase